MVKRAAFTLIELIFAIIIIAISVMSLPTMIQSVSDGIESNLVQEAIFAASTELNQAITGNWDANSTIETGVNGLARVIDNGNCKNNSSHSRYRLKPGHIAQPYHRRCLDSNVTTIANIAANNSLESYAGVNTLINAGASQSGYKYIYQTQVTVYLNGNFDRTNRSDIKMIEANITNQSTGLLLTSLKAFSANIGEVDYYRRTY